MSLGDFHIPSASPTFWHWRVRTRFLTATLLLAAALLSPFQARAELQFDVFLGYDNVVREAAWFPVVCEIFNDGPSFNAVVEIGSGQMRGDQVRRIPIELPNNTRKRFAIPMFCSGSRFMQWNARLLDDKERVQAERSNLQPRLIAWETIMLGAMPRTFAGMPTFPEVRSNRPELKPHVARLLADQFPDNAIALEGIEYIYLNSEKALELKVNQIAALLAWLHNGGHLVVSVEQLTDINATPWLQQLLPAQLSGMSNATLDDAVQLWLRQEELSAFQRAGASEFRRRFSGNPRFRPPSGPSPYLNMQPDAAFAGAQLPVATGNLRDGQVALAAEGKPLIIEAARGRGQITLLTFSPEREPFRSWKNRGWFWAKVLNVPSEWFAMPDIPAWGGLSIDGVFGAMIDSRQVRKLPVQWLLLLLVVYLVVIGPLDQYWLKKIGRQMLTWITFPTYVVLFSLLIYFIGYKLRAGQTEWNELHVVDVLPRAGGQAELRGRTYASVYSSSNARYPLAFNPPSADEADRTHAAFRGELLDLSMGREGARANIEQYGNVFRAEIFVPVWTSLLFVNDWLQPRDLPMIGSVSTQGSGWQVEVENRLDRPLADARIVIQETIYDLGSLPPGKKTFTLQPSQGRPLRQFIEEHSLRFAQAVEQRRTVLGNERQGWLDKPSLHSMVASFPSYLTAHNQPRGFVSPPGFDLTPVVVRGDAVLLAWDANNSFTQPLNQFTPPMSSRSTLLRLAIPAPGNRPS